METLSQVSCRTCDKPLTGKQRKFCSPRCRQKAFYEVNPRKTKSYDEDYRALNRDKRNANDRARHAQGRTYLQQIKTEKGCARCGYNEHPAALDFNHIDPTTKSFNIASCASHSKELLDAEIAKCEILCANCHRIHTYDTHPTRMGNL
jgi:hypothetical protein